MRLNLIAVLVLLAGSAYAYIEPISSPPTATPYMNVGSSGIDSSGSVDITGASSFLTVQSSMTAPWASIGRLGIGITNPSQPLHINGSGSQYIYVTDSALATEPTYFGLWNNAGDRRAYIDGYDGISLNINTSEKVAITAANGLAMAAGLPIQPGVAGTAVIRAKTPVKGQMIWCSDCDRGGAGTSDVGSLCVATTTAVSTWVDVDNFSSDCD